MSFATDFLSNDDCKTLENLFGVVLADGDSGRTDATDELGCRTDLPRLYTNFYDGQSLFELTLRRVRKVISPKRLAVIVRQKHMAIEEVCAQINLRAQHHVVLQSRRDYAVPALFQSLMGIHQRCPTATVTLFPADHFVMPECSYLRGLRQAWRVLASPAERSDILLLGMEPHGTDLGYCYIVPERGFDSSATMKISLFGRAQSPEVARRLIGRGALWYSGIIVAKCHALIEVIREVMPALYDSYPALAAAENAAELDKVFAGVLRKHPKQSFVDILRSLSWERRRCLGVFPIRGVYWSELSDQQRQRECLEKMTGFNLAAELDARSWFKRQPELAEV